MITRAARSRGRAPSTASAAMFASARSVVGQLVLAQVGLAGRRSRRRCRPRSARSPRPPAGRSRTPAPGRSRASRPRSRARPSRSRRRARCRAARASSSCETELRRRMAAGAEGAARIDHDRDRVLVRLLPRRADPERADPDRLVELAPAILPVLLDVGGGGTAERLPDPLLAGGVRVRRELEPPPSPSISSKPCGKSSSMTARACSARASGTVTETRRSRVSGGRF